MWTAQQTTKHTTTGECGKFLSKQGEFGGSSHVGKLLLKQHFPSTFSSRCFTFKDTNGTFDPVLTSPPRGRRGVGKQTVFLNRGSFFMKASCGNSNYARRILPVYRYYSALEQLEAGAAANLLDSRCSRSVNAIRAFSSLVHVLLSRRTVR